jgi:hypothetical protein
MNRLLMMCALVAAVFGGTARAATNAHADLLAEFLALCDAAAPAVRENAHSPRKGHRSFYWDSYAVRALCVAYDMTGRKEYLEASRTWAGAMAGYQKEMAPQGAYYMQYYRKPGETNGPWYVADSSSIALGVLATAVRCQDPKEKSELLGSVRSFAELVSTNWVMASGGIANGHWPQSDKEWWCCTGIFGSLAFHLYAETGDENYLGIGLGAIDWLSRQDLLADKAYPAPTIVMYSLEAFSAALPYIEKGTGRYDAFQKQIARLDAWMRANLGGKSGDDYITQWGSKYGGLPFHLCQQARYMENDQLRDLADAELKHIARALKDSAPVQHRDQLALFAMMSYAERLNPGGIDRTSR